MDREVDRDDRPAVPSGGLTNADRLMISFGRALSGNPRFFEHFYELLMASHPAIEPMFARTDFSRQVEHLRNGLNMVIMFDRGDSYASSTLERIAQTHGRDGYNISHELYNCWSSCLLQVLAEADPSFDDAIAAEWRRVIDNAINNAVRYTKSKIMLKASKADGFLILSVQDDGEGYPESMLMDGASDANIATDIDVANSTTGLGLFFSRIVGNTFILTLQFKSRTIFLNTATCCASFCPK